MTLNPDILDVLACPNCKGKLTYHKDTKELVCKFDKVSFPIENGVPILLISRAKPLKSD